MYTTGQDTVLGPGARFSTESPGTLPCPISVFGDKLNVS